MALEPIPSIPESTVYYTRLSIGPYERQGDGFQLAKFDEKLIIHLPLPTELRDDTAVSYTNVNLETVGDLIQNRSNAMSAAALRNSGALAQLATSATAAGISGLVANRFPGSGLVGAAAEGFATTIQSIMPADQITSVLQQKYGAAPNPNPSVMFQGPVLRDFSFTWAFYPKNAEESKTIQSLIKKLKGRALPSENKGISAAILNYPHICQLNFFPWDTNPKDEINGWGDNSIIKIKKCFMQSVNVNYNAFGTPGFFEGTQLPISYQLSIQFKEIDYLLSKDWDSEAASERAKSETEVTTALVLTQAFKQIGSGVAAGVSEIGPVLKDLITGDIPDKNAQDAEDRAQDSLEALTPPRQRQPAPEPVVFTKPPEQGMTGNYTYSLTKSKEGKYVLVQSFPSIGGGGDGPITPRDPVTTEYDTEVAARAFVKTEAVFTKGKQTNPPQEEAAAPAP